MALNQVHNHYGPCDSYFVDNSDDGIFAIRAELRDRSRAIARMQHRQLGEELSRVTADEYQEDHLDHMEHMEVRGRCATIFLIDVLTQPGGDNARCELH